MVQGSGSRVQGAGCRVQGSGFRVQGSGFRVQGPWFRVKSVGDYGFGSGVQDMMFRFQSSRYKAYTLGLRA